MPEHVHLLISEPERKNLAVVVQMLKQVSTRKLRSPDHEDQFWQRRYYDFNVSGDSKRIEKLRYIHRNPVERGLAEKPEDWQWSSFRHYLLGDDGTVKIESHWTARKRELQGISLKIELKPRTELPHPPSK
jgi:putative transposase